MPQATKRPALNKTDTPEGKTRSELAEQARELAKKHGTAKAAKMLGMSRQAFLALCADLEVKAGTKALAREGLRMHCAKAV